MGEKRGVRSEESYYNEISQTHLFSLPSGTE
jgi:hypothetical protein